MKLFEIFVYVCGGVIFLFTIVLVVLNWNQEIKTKVLSSFLLGTVTIFALIYWGLKETKTTDSFRTSVAISDSTNLPIIVIDLTGSKAVKRQETLGILSNPRIIFNGTEIIAFETPTNFNEASRFGGELLQYVIIKKIQESQQQGVLLARMTDGNQYSMERGIDKPFRATKMDKVILLKSKIDTTQNRFFKPPSEQFHWENHSFLLPPKTSITIGYMPAAEGTGPEKHLIFVTKKNYFEITISIQALGAANKTAAKVFELSPDVISKTSTYTYLITVDAKFDKFTAGSAKTEEYKKWVQWTTDQIKAALADEAML